MIKFGSALDSIMMRGISHDGPANVRPTVETIVAKVPEVTTADKIVVKPVKQKNVKQSVKSEKDVKQGFDRKTYMRKYMAAKRKSKHAKNV